MMSRLFSPGTDQPSWWPTRKLIVAFVTWLVTLGLQVPDGTPELVADVAEQLGPLVAFGAAYMVRNRSMLAP